MADMQRDDRSEIMNQFQDIATRCLKSLRAVSDSGEVLCTYHISLVRAEIIKELGNLYFNGLPEKQT